MFKTTVKLDPVFDKKFKSIRKETAEVIVAMVEAEFVDLLHNAPQYSGNFVANMFIRSSTRGAGSRGGDPNAMPPLTRSKEGRARAFARGQLPAIAKAKAANANLKKNLTAHISSSAGWFGGLTVYNRLQDAETIEGLDVKGLREVNRPGVHSMARFGALLRTRLNTRIVWGDGNWYKYLRSNYL